MKSIFLIVILCCLLTEVALAQKPVTGFRAKGVVLDSAGKAPIEFVTVLVRETGKGEVLKSTFTDSKGIFELNNISLRQFELVFSFVGYKAKIIQATAPPGEILDIGNILLSAQAKQLAEVQVVSEQALVIYDIDKTTYNVEADPDSKTQQTIDVLRKVPHLTVDADDNIKLKGNGNYTVLVNGKPSSLFTKNAKEVFRSMPASSIKNIEVITTPPSRYDAEGVAGIINIVTHKQKHSGYNGSFNLSASRPKGYYAGGYITVAKRNFGLSAYYGYNSNASPDTRLRLLRKDHIQAESRLEQNGSKDYRGNFKYLEGELSYSPDSLNLLSANYSINTNRGSNSYIIHNQIKSNSGQLNQAYTQQYDVLNRWLGTDAGADYQRSFKKNKEQLFTLSYKLRLNKDNSNADFNFIPALNYTGSLNKTENNGSFKEHTLQADYVQPLKKQLLELGIKSILRSNRSNYYYKGFNPATNTYELKNTLSNLFDYAQHIHAAYSSLTLHRNKWGLKLGGRLENTRVRANFRSSGTVAEQDQLNLIPNLILSRQLENSGLIKLAYWQRIERPGLYYLNPYQNIIDPKNISFGNPALLPAINNQFDLSYSTYFNGTSFSASTYYNYTDNAIQRYTTTGTDGIARTTFGNIGKRSNYGISLSGNIDLQEKLNININSSTNYVWLTSLIENKPQSNKGYTFDIFCYISYKLGGNWRISGNQGYNAPGILLQGKSGDYFYNSFALDKDFLKNNKASLTFNVSNPFRKERRWFNELNTTSFYQFQESFVLNRWFSLTFNYRFGKLEDDIARKKRGISNDDIKAVEKKIDEN